MGGLDIDLQRQACAIELPEQTRTRRDRPFGKDLTEGERDIGLRHGRLVDDLQRAHRRALRGG